MLALLLVTGIVLSKSVLDEYINQLYGIQENYLSDFSLSFKKINQEGQGERSLAQCGCVLS